MKLNSKPFTHPFCFISFAFPLCHPVFFSWAGDHIKKKIPNAEKSWVVDQCVFLVIAQLVWLEGGSFPWHKGQDVSLQRGEINDVCISPFSPFMSRWNPSITPTQWHFKLVTSNYPDVSWHRTGGFKLVLWLLWAMGRHSSRVACTCPQTWSAGPAHTRLNRNEVSRPKLRRDPTKCTKGCKLRKCQVCWGGRRRRSHSQVNKAALVLLWYYTDCVHYSQISRVGFRVISVE